MRAAVLVEYGAPLEIRSVDRPTPPADGVVVETEACGVCRSDWHAWRGDWDWLGARTPLGQVLGHEPAGRVVEVGPDVETVSEGDRVAVPFTLADGTCHYCRTGRANLCTDLVPLGFVEDAPGAFAEAFPVPSADGNVVRLPDGVDPVDMAGLGCRFVTAYHALAHRADLTPGDWVAVHGCGGVGLSAVHVADALGCGVVAVDLDADKLALAATLGADATVDASAVDDVPREIVGLTDGGAAVSVDALGIAETCRNSVACLARGGQHLQIGLTSGEERGEVALPTDAMVFKELDFLGSYGMPPPRFDELLRLIAQGKLDPGRVVSGTIGLEDVSDQLVAMGDYGTTGIPVVTEF